MGILQTWLLKDSKSWSKKDAKFLVNSLLRIDDEKVDMKRWGHPLYYSGFEKLKFSEVNISFSQAEHFRIHRLGYTYFSKDEEEFFCREVMTSKLRGSLTDNAEIRDAKRMCLIREYLDVPNPSVANKDKYAFVEENWYKYVQAFLGMCGVSKNIRQDFVGYNPKSRLAVFPASLALWRSTFLTAPSVLIGLLRNGGLFINDKLDSFYTLPETLEILLKDKEKSWNARTRQTKYYVFGTNSMLWMSLLWINKLRAVCDDTKYNDQERYIDGPNSFIAACKESVTKVLKNLSKDDKKEIYILLGGKKDNAATYSRIINSYAKEIKTVMQNFPQEVN